MRVLMITEKDAVNFSLAPIARAFMKYGHEVDVHALYLSENVLRMFDRDIIKYDINDLTLEIIDRYDIIFAATFSLNKLREKQLLNVKKYIFTYDFFIHGEIVNGGDFNFSPSLNNTVSVYKNEMKFIKMGIGEPKYDLIEGNQDRESNKLLFIDSGHYPFGSQGKIELAKLLISICRRLPNHELIIKPRFLRDDEVVTHKNSVHLYDLIEDVTNGMLPANLIMLNEHVELEKLINKSQTVLCMYTTAYMSALVANKGLIIIDGLPNEDVYDIRHKRFMQTRKGMIGTNALVHYKKVLNYLPHGIQSPNSHIAQELANFTNVSEKVVEVTEHIFNNFINKNEFPVNQVYEYIDYKNTISRRDGATWDTVISERYENTLKYYLLTEIDYRVHEKLDLKQAFEYIDKEKKAELLTIDKFNLMFKDLTNVKMKLMIENSQLMINNDIDFSMLLEAYFHQGKYDEIKKMNREHLASYCYFRGRVAVEEEEFELAKTMLGKYLKDSINRPYIKEKSDSDQFRVFAIHKLIELHLKAGELNKAREIWELYKTTTGYNNKMNIRLEGTLVREEAYKKITTKWLDILSDNRIEGVLKQIDSEKIMVYGAGSISENLISKTELLMNKVVLFIDQNIDTPVKFGRPLISPREIINYASINTVLVTVPHAFNSIKESLLLIRQDLNIISILELVSDI